MFYDEEQKTVFLELNSIHDMPQLIKACRRMNVNLSMAVSSVLMQELLETRQEQLLYFFQFVTFVLIHRLVKLQSFNASVFFFFKVCHKSKLRHIFILCIYVQYRGIFLFYSRNIQVPLRNVRKTLWEL